MDKDFIRALIRDVIAEEVKAIKNGKAPSTAPSSPEVRIASDADLAAFAREVLRLAKDPKVRAAIEAGHHTFRLSTSRAVTQTTTHPSGASHRVDKGVVTEGAIAKLGKDVSRLILGPGVSITPLARDKAKARNISVERIGQ